MIGVSLAAAMPSADKAKTELSFSAAQDNSSLLSGQADPFMALMLSLLKDWQAPAQSAPVGEKKPAKDTRLDIAVEPVISHCTQTNPGDIPAGTAGQTGMSGPTTDDSMNEKTGRARLLPSLEPGKDSSLNGSTSASLSRIASNPLIQQGSAGASPSRFASNPLALNGSAGASPSQIASHAFGEIAYPKPSVATSESQPLALSDVRVVADVPPESVDALKPKDANAAAIEPVRMAGHSEHVAQIEPAGSDKQVTHAAPANSIQDHLSVQLAQLRDAGHHELHLTLHPPELGPVHLHLELDGERLSIHIAVHADDAKAALEQQLEPLRIRFAEMGLSLGQFDVRQDGSNHQQDDGSYLPVGQRGAVLARKPYFRVAKPSGRVDVIA